MRAVPTTKTFADPRTHHRYVYLWGPFLSSELYFPPSRRKSLQKRYQSAIEDITPTTMGALELERIYHEELYRRLHSLKGKVVIFTTGISPDNTPVYLAKPKQLGIDPISDRNRLSSSIQDISKEVYEEWQRREKVFPLDEFIYIPLAPVLFPYRINQEFAVEHAVPAAIDVANEVAREKGKLTFGDTVKTLESRLRYASSKFSASVFDSHLAKLFFLGDERELEDATLLDRYLFVNGLANIVRELVEPEDNHPRGEFNVYSKRGSYAFILAQKTQELLRAQGTDLKLSDFSKAMRNTELSKEGECDPRALDILKGFLHNVGATMGNVDMPSTQLHRLRLFG